MMSATNRKPFLSVCIPAYNRPAELAELLDSVLAEDFRDFEVVIAEDRSPMRDEIRAVAEACTEKYPEKIRYFENSRNLGYDGNFRNLLELARGEYCLFMGNDDLLYPGALKKLADMLHRHSNVGVVLRSYASFDGTPDRISQEYRYFDRERIFPPGPQSVATFFRRSVVISGLALHRQSARKFATDRFDGSLLYQLHLVANVLLEKNGLATPELIALYRLGGSPDFGAADAERGKHVPGQQTPESSLDFVEGMMRIARETEAATGADIYRPIVRDMSNYSYPFLHVQSRLPRLHFFRYAGRLGRLGMFSNPYFHAYFWMLFLVGRERADRLVGFIKQRRGATPLIGTVYEGNATQC